MRQTHVSYRSVGAGALFLLALAFLGTQNYLLFHTLAEMASILVACGIFVIAWNSRQFAINGYLVFFGIASLAIAVLDLTHTLAYKGMSIFPGYGADLPTQLWIASRSLEAVSLLLAPFWLRRKARWGVLLAAYAFAVTALLLSIFSWRVFPVCFVEGAGLTAFKQAGEYVICLILATAAALLIREREQFDPGVLKLLVAAMAATIVSELAFVLYVDVYGLSNLVGHLLKVVAFALYYLAIIETGFKKPLSLLLRDLKQKEEALLESDSQARAYAELIRSANEELAASNEELQAQTEELQSQAEELQSQAEELRVQTEELRESEERYRGLVELSPDAVFINREGRITFVNPAAVHLFGATSPDQLLGRSPFELFHPDCHPIMRERIGKLSAGERAPLLEECIVRLDGMVRDVEVAAAPIADQGGPAIQVILRDITDRKRAEDALRRSEARLQTIVENLGEGLIVSGMDGQLLHWNRAALEMHGFAGMEECLLQLRRFTSSFEMATPDGTVLPFEQWPMNRILSGEHLHDCEIRIRRLDKEWQRIYSYGGTLVPGPDGQSQIAVLTITDITARKQAEEALRESEKSLRRKAAWLDALRRAVPDLQFVTDGEGTFLDYVAGQTADLYIPPEEFLHKRFGDVLPAPVATKLDRAIREARETGSVAAIEYAMVLHGKEQWFESRVTPFADGLYLTVARNITERKRAEAALRESHRDLNRAQSVARIGSWHYDVRTDELRWSAETHRIFGIPEGTILDYATFLSKVHPQDREYVDREWAAASSNHTYQVEHRIVVGDAVKWVRQHSELEFDKNGELLAAFGTVQDITALKHAEEELRRRAEEVEALMNLAPVAIWVAHDPQCREITGNHLANEFYEAAAGENVSAGSNPGEHIGPRRFFHHGKELTAERLPMQYAAARGMEVQNAELDVLLPSGKWLSLLGAAIPLRDAEGQVRGCLGAFLDITERKRVEDALAVSERRFRLLSRTAGSLLATENPQSVISELCREVMAHLDCQMFLSFLADEAHGRLTLNAHAGIPEEDAWMVETVEYGMAVCGCAAQGREMILAEDVLNSTDKHMAFLRSFGVQAYCCHPLIVEDRLIGTLSFGTRTRPRFTPDEVELMRIVSEQVAIAMQRLQDHNALREADRRKDEFLAMLAHELRNPLAAVCSAIQVLQSCSHSEPLMVRAREAADRQSAHMARLLDDLLDVSRVTQGKITLRTEDVSLATIIESAVEAIRPAIEERRHQLQLSIPAEALRVKGDPVRLAQVVSNLLANAAKFTPDGGRIHLSLEQEAEHALIRVRDNGAGIAADILPRVFDLFTQAHNNSERAQGGLGIGLTMVRLLVEMHGGRVDGYSDGLGLGSEFTVRLPLVQAQSVEEEARSSEEIPIPPLRILVVDDNPDAADLLAMTLELDGHEILTAYSGAAAIDRALTETPAVILLDIGMPGMDGYAVVQRLRQEPTLADTVLVALTGYGQEEDRTRALAAGFDHHLVKPVDVDALRELLATLG